MLRSSAESVGFTFTAGGKRFALCLDTGHALLLGHDIYTAIMQIGDRLDYVKERVRRPGRHSFRSLLGSSATKLEIVITFLAILELIKTGDIRLTEDSTRDDFTLEDNAA